MKVYSGKCEHGVCGRPTNLTDAVGKELFIGDIVVVTSRDGVIHSLTVVMDARPFDNTESPFIMGIASVDIAKDESWRVDKVKGWEDVIDGENWKDFGFNYRQ